MREKKPEPWVQNHENWCWATAAKIVGLHLIIDWLDREGWDYEVSYIGDYVFGKGGGEEDHIQHKQVYMFM